MSADFPLTLVFLGCAFNAGLEADYRSPLVGTPGRRKRLSPPWYNPHEVHPAAVELNSLPAHVRLATSSKHSLTYVSPTEIHLFATE